MASPVLSSPPIVPKLVHFELKSTGIDLVSFVNMLGYLQVEIRSGHEMNVQLSNEFWQRWEKLKPLLAAAALNQGTGVDLLV